MIRFSENIWHKSSAGSIFRSLLLMFLFCSFSASSVSLQTCFVNDVFIQLVELNENESKESGDDNSCEKDGDQDPFPYRFFENAYASVAGNHHSSPIAHLAKKFLDKASTPPPEQA